MKKALRETQTLRAS